MIEHLTRTRWINPIIVNHSSSETTVGQKINLPDNSRGKIFPNPLMPVKNVHNCHAHSWLKNMIHIAGDSMINRINEKCLSANSESVKVRCFSGTMINNKLNIIE